MLLSHTPAITGALDPRWPRVIALLRALDIIRVSYRLDGEGDSGECALAEVEYADGRSTADLPDLPVGFSSSGTVYRLPPVVEVLAADLPEGDWINNEGGYGTIEILPFEENPESRFECDMTYRDYYDEYDDDEFEEIELDDDTVIEAPGDAVPAIRIEEAGQ